jgi:murein DD-endopeptidase MepM/ murein hydrolase activator NlpD
LGRGNVKVSIQSAFDNKGVRQAETSLDHLNTHAKRSFGEATKHALGYGAALVGGAGIVGGLEAVAHASIEAGTAQAALDAQLKAVGISYKGHQKQIDGVLEKTSRLTGFMDKDLEGALGNIVRSTGNLGQSFKLLGLATDIARAKHIDVASAGQLVGKIFAGNTRVLKSLGIQLDPVTKAQDKLKESTKHATDEQKRAAVAEDKRATAQKAIALLQQKLGGQAEAYGKTTAGSLDKMKAAVDRLEIRIGNALAPTVKKVADAVAKFVDQMESGKGAGGRFARTMDNLWKSIKPVLGVVVDTAKWLGKHPALLKAAGLAWVAYKTAALTQIALVKAAELGLFGASTSRRVETSAGASGARAGRAFRLAFVAGATYLLYQELSGPFNKALESLTGQINATDPTNGRAQQQADARTKRLYGNLPNQGNIPRLGPVSPKYLPTVPKKVRVSSVGDGVMAHTSSTAGGGGGTFFVVGSGGKIIGTPYAGTHHAGQNWQSSNAIDIAVPVGTPVYAAGGGTITRAGALPGSPGGRFAGERVQIGNQFWYGHLSKLAVHQGERVSAGDLLGYSGSANGVAHLHFASRTGTPHETYKGSQSGGAPAAKWRECVLTWYDPALGGINTGGGSKDPYHPTASGENYNPKAYTCAAPSGYSFGTIIIFAVGGRAVACKVNDRGGAITGHHFDLSRAAAASLGIMGAGTADGFFMLPGKSKSIKKAKTPFDKLQNQLGYIDLEAQAGVLTQRQSDNAIIQAVNKALPNLTGSNKLRALGERRQARQDLRSLPKPRKPVKPHVDTSIDSPWLQTWIQHQQDLMDAGQLDPIVGRDNIANVLDQFAKGKGVSEHDRLTATAQARDLRFQNLADITSAVPAVPDSVSDEGVRLAHIDAQLRAGDITDEQARGAKIASLQDALGTWNLTDDARLELRGELNDLTAATQDLTAATQDQTALLQQQIDVEKERSAQLERALAVAQSEERTLGRSLANQLGLTFGIRAGMGKLLPTVGAAQ